MAEQPVKPKRRMVKKAETIREKTAKAAGPKKPEKADILRLTFGYIVAPFRWISRLPAKCQRFLRKFKIFRTAAKIAKIIGKILWPAYFRNSWKELRQVTWPNRRETRHLTLAVIIFAVIFGTLVAVVDFGLDKLFKQLIIK